MLTDLDKLTGIDFSKKYVEINSYEDICYYDGLSCQQEMKEYADLEDYQDIENAEDVTDINFITSYVSHLIFGLGQLLTFFYFFMINFIYMYVVATYFFTAEISNNTILMYFINM